ncbi:MAG: hypothetical protein JXA14_25300 [Anaerolineae bacterium]|nr:hypothetical protein [Anaerolineae bacterium]
MKRSHLAVMLSVLVVLIALLAGAAAGAAQSGPVPDARPTPTPELPLPEGYQPSPVPRSPEIPPLPDLVITDIDLIPAAPVLGEVTIIRVTIYNRSQYDVTPGNNFWSDLYIDPAIVPIQLGQDGVAEWPCQATWVPAGGYHTLETTYIFDDVKVYALWAQVDTDGHVQEANEHNNVWGPKTILVDAPNMILHDTHEEFQMGLASTLDISDSEGVMRPGLFDEPWQDPEIYFPDARIDTPDSLLPPAGATYKINVNQFKPAIASDGAGTLYAVWEDGRNGTWVDHDIFFATSTDGGLTWSDDEPVNLDSGGVNANQISPDIAYDTSRDLLYIVWQDERDDPGVGQYDIYFRSYDPVLASWGPEVVLNDDVGMPTPSNQLNPAIAVGKSDTDPGPNKVYVVWQDRRHGNDDIYLARSDDGGANWTPNYFVGDDPAMTPQVQAAPAVSVENLFGIVVVGWEDWRDPEHPEVYTMWSLDQGETFGVDVPVTIVSPEERMTYRRAPDLAAHTTVEWVPRYDDDGNIIGWELVAVTVIHVAWQEGTDELADIYYSFAPYDWGEPDPCPVPYDYCFEEPQMVSGYELPADYVRPPGDTSSYPLEPTWQGEVSLDLVPDNYHMTLCLLESSDWYSKGVMIAWSDARTYDEWRHEIRVRRVASPEGDPKGYVVCERPRDAGPVNSNAKLHIFRDDLTWYDLYKPAAARQSNPYIVVDADAIYVAWDDDRWDDPRMVGVQNRDVFAAKTADTTYGSYVSPVLDARTNEPDWYVLSWWAATDHYADVLFQTRFGNTPTPPQEDVAENTWTQWTGNAGSSYLDCNGADPTEVPCCPDGSNPGAGCYYDAPGRHIVDPDGNDWFGPFKPGPYRYMQYKILMRSNRLAPWTALTQVKVYYKGPPKYFLPVVFRNY